MYKLLLLMKGSHSLYVERQPSVFALILNGMKMLEEGKDAWTGGQEVDLVGISFFGLTKVLPAGICFCTTTIVLHKILKYSLLKRR